MTPKHKLNLSIIIFCLIYIIFIVFVISPLFSGIKKNSQDLVSQKQTLVSFEAQLESLNRFKNLYQEIEPNLEKISNLFINPEVPVEFINFLETSASSCQLFIDISSALPTKAKEDPWPALVFQINSIGSFPKFLKFLEKLEASPYLIRIQVLNIRRLTEVDFLTEAMKGFVTGDVRVVFSIKVFTHITPR
ncbi:hypothetical protein AMJ50_00700 [Parcubacteria bacterium DG_74_3]|nr:MAG: hypothetical protein AMJ50_00700 [Parcubacteria bacterium DG_74_3]